MSVNDGGPAFPHGPLGDTMHGEEGRVWHQFPAGAGMTLRDYFAGQAIAGVIRSTVEADSAAVLSESADATGLAIEQVIARSAYEIADAMLAAREKAGGAS